MERSSSKLSPTWFVEGTIDLEYKRYILLSYLLGVEQSFRQVRLFPAMRDLAAHQATLRSYQQQKWALEALLPREITGVNLKRLQWIFQRIEEDPAVLQEVDAIVADALALLQDALAQGKAIQDFVDENLRLYPIGVVPLYTQEGYLLVRIGNNRTISVYRFESSSLFDSARKAFAMKLVYITNFRYTLVQTYTHMKRVLARTLPDLPNPATFALESTLAFPRAETLLPVAGQRLAQELAA